MRLALSRRRRAPGSTFLTLAALALSATAAVGCVDDDAADDLAARVEDAADELAGRVDDALDDLDDLGDPARDDGDVAAFGRAPVLERLRDNLDALRAAGVTGVLAELEVGRREVRARRGVARLGDDGPVPWDGRFRMGSVTKTFVAVVVLQLVGEGRLGLDDAVEAWLPGVVAGEGYDAAQITVRDLLRHTSGIPNYTQDIFASFTPERYFEDRFRHYEPAELVAMALRRPPDFAPGGGWNYSNTNYVLAGMLIERVTGRAWPAEVRARIVEPLRLRDTTEPGDDPDLPDPHARGYEQFAEGGELVDVTLQNHTFGGAAGSLITTTGDLARFWRALQRGRLLGPAEMAEMRRTVEATTLQGVLPGVRYGLGIMQFPSSCGRTYWTHFGDTTGFSTRGAVDDDGTRVVVVSLSTNLVGAAGGGVFAANQRLLDDAMCAPRR